MSKPRLQPHGTKWYCTGETEPITLVQEGFSYLLLVELPLVHLHDEHLLLVVPIYLLEQFIDLLVLIGARFTLFSLGIWDGDSGVADLHASFFIAVSQLNQQFVLLRVHNGLVLFHKLSHLILVADVDTLALLLLVVLDILMVEFQHLHARVLLHLDVGVIFILDFGT